MFMFMHLLVCFILGVGNNWGSNNSGGSQPAAGNNIQQQWATANQRPPTSQDGI